MNQDAGCDFIRRSAGRYPALSIDFNGIVPSGISSNAIVLILPPEPPATSKPDPNDPVESKLRALFESRPIWARSSLLLELSASEARALKRCSPCGPDLTCCSVLPIVSYNFSGGPWNKMWVRLGFDPRVAVEPNISKLYQVIDFRVPAELVAQIGSQVNRLNPML